MISLWKNAFPVSGQLYTTHLLSLEALLTVIDSIEAHCQAKVPDAVAQQDQSDTLLAEGEASSTNGTDSTTGMFFSYADFVFLWTLSKLRCFSFVFRTNSAWQH